MDEPGSSTRSGTRPTTGAEPSGSSGLDFKTKVFNDPIHGSIKVHRLCAKIIDTPQFQRLRHLKQLGGAYFVYPGACHNRFEHSLGVSHLAGKFGQQLRMRQPELGITDSDILCLEIAGLCHDLGHGPFSHMFETFLKQVGVEWKHEKASGELIDYMTEQYSTVKTAFFEDAKLTDQDIIFIKELINPPKKEGQVPSYKGRGLKKSFLYEIVSNERTGIDVDKWDYFARDCHQLGLTNSFDYERLMHFARVIEVNGVYQICYRDKAVDNIYEMFEIRMKLHKRAYQHRVNKLIEHMVCDAMEAANNVELIPGSGEGDAMEGADNVELIPESGKRLRLSECIRNMAAYTKLDDTILNTIMIYPHNELQKAQKILTAINERRLYYLAGQTIAKPTQCMQKKDQITSWVVRNCKGPEVVEADVLVIIASWNYSKGTKDPIDDVKFYKKNKLEEAFTLPEHRRTPMTPATFCAHVVYVYYRDLDENDEQRQDKREAISASFKRWCALKGYEADDDSN